MSIGSLQIRICFGAGRKRLKTGLRGWRYAHASRGEVRSVHLLSANDDMLGHEQGSRYCTFAFWVLEYDGINKFRKQMFSWFPPDEHIREWRKQMDSWSYHVPTGEQMREANVQFLPLAEI